MTQPTCIGITGRLFGHKFIKSAGGYLYTSNACYRCGFIPGGLNEKENSRTKEKEDRRQEETT